MSFPPFPSHLPLRSGRWSGRPLRTALIVAGIVQPVNAYFQKQQADQEISAGVLRQIVAQATAKARDEAIATRIDLQATPAGKSDILGGG